MARWMNSGLGESSPWLLTDRGLCPSTAVRWFLHPSRTDSGVAEVGSVHLRLEIRKLGEVIWKIHDGDMLGVGNGRIDMDRYGYSNLDMDILTNKMSFGCVNKWMSEVLRYSIFSRHLGQHPNLHCLPRHMLALISDQE